MIRLLPLSLMAVLIADRLVKVWVVAMRGVRPVRLWSFVQIRTTRT